MGSRSRGRPGGEERHRGVATRVQQQGRGSPDHGKDPTGLGEEWEVGGLRLLLLPGFHSGVDQLRLENAHY